MNDRRSGGRLGRRTLMLLRQRRNNGSTAIDKPASPAPVTAPQPSNPTTR